MAKLLSDTTDPPADNYDGVLTQLLGNFGVAALLLPCIHLQKYIKSDSLTEKCLWKALQTVIPHAGPTMQKAVQWSGSRPDLFGWRLSSLLSNSEVHARSIPYGRFLLSFANAHGVTIRPLDLNSDTGQIYQNHCARNKYRIIKPYKVKIYDSDVILDRNGDLGAGVIAQVYRGAVITSQECSDVAIKVAKAGVARRMNNDLSVIDRLVNVTKRYGCIDRLVKTLPFDLSAIATEFSSMLKPQLNLINEVQNIQRFQSNFQPCTEIPPMDPLYTAGAKSYASRERYLLRIPDSLSNLIRRRSFFSLGCITVPSIYKPLSNNKCAVMSYEEGESLSSYIHNKSQVDLSPEDIRKISECIRLRDIFRACDVRGSRSSGFYKHKPSDKATIMGKILTSAKDSFSILLKRYRNPNSILETTVKYIAGKSYTFLDVLEKRIHFLETSKVNIPPRSVSGRFVATIALSAMNQMIFRNNFVHSDMHPGNILIRLAKPETIEKFRRAGLYPLPIWEFVILDYGLCTPISIQMRKNLIDLLSRFAYKRDMSEVSDLIVYRTTQNQEKCDVAGFTEDLRNLANEMNFFDLSGISNDDTKATFGELVSRFLTSAYKRKIRLQNEFVQLGIALMIFDGIRSSLASQIDLVQSILPWLLT